MLDNQDHPVDATSSGLVEAAQSGSVHATSGQDPEAAAPGEVTAPPVPAQRSLLTTIKIWLMGGKSKFDYDGPMSGGVRG